jgi:predicted nucleic acid binding AN1-type Zn finger protein
MRYFPLMCGYCGEVHCKDHELPENHNCPNLLARKWGIYADDKISFSVAE